MRSAQILLYRLLYLIIADKLTKILRSILYVQRFSHRPLLSKLKINFTAIAATCRASFLILLLIPYASLLAFISLLFAVPVLFL